MIIEHEAAGTLLKSTENRAGGFTCRINFYLVSSLTVPHPASPLPIFLATHYTGPRPVSLRTDCLFHGSRAEITFPVLVPSSFQWLARRS